MLNRLARVSPLCLVLLAVSLSLAPVHDAPVGATYGASQDPSGLQSDVTSACDQNALGMANPAAVYCRELGYDYRIVDTAGGQQGVCAFPDGSVCNDWRFLQGQCGLSHSYCARHGYGSNIKTDGMNSLSRAYSVCTRGQQEIGAATDLMGLSDESTRGSLAVEPSVSSSGEEAPMVGAPPSFDWRNYGGQNWMTPVKNQGQCGSCWAFSTVGVVEAVYNIGTGNPSLDLNLSEEYLVSDCLPGNSCCGGWMETALSFVRDEGIPDEQCLPYVDLSSCTCGTSCNSICTYRTGGSCSDATCSQRCSDWQSRLVTIEALGDVSPSQIKQTLVDRGPLTAAMGYGSGYGGYWDGDIYRCTSDTGANHGVVIAGYSDAGGYWIIKNSWGSTWNGDGYFKIGYGECAIENYVNYAVSPTAPDQDGDTVPDSSDNCPLVANPTQTDTDGDGLGDACDPDDDNDTVPDASDNCDFVVNPGQANHDGDAMGDACDPDDDNDTALDGADNCPLVANPTQTDSDGDSLGDACDSDDDNDGFVDEREQYIGTDPLDTCPDVTGTPGLCPGPSCDGDDCWAFDLNVDRRVTIGDVLFFGPVMGDAAGDPDFESRYDLDVSGRITVGDVLFFGPVMGQRCTNP